MQSRRTFLRTAAVLAGSALLAACGSKVATGRTEDFLGDERVPGDPIWSERPPAYLVAFGEPELARVRRTYPAALLATIADRLVALAPACPADGTVVGYCTDARSFVCPTCASAFDRWGHVVDGPAGRGLDHRPVELVAGELIVRTGATVPGPAPAGVRPDGSRGPRPGTGARCTGRITLPPGSTGGPV